MKLGTMCPIHVLFVICIFPLAYFTHKFSVAPKTISDQIVALKNAGTSNILVTNQCEAHMKTIFHFMKLIKESDETSRKTIQGIKCSVSIRIDSQMVNNRMQKFRGKNE